MIAACGTGMGALACMLKELGFEVTGSDQNVYPPMSDFLREKGIGLFKGYDAANLGHKPDLVIIGNAVSRGNVEAEAVIERGMPFCSMPQALNHFVAKGKKQIVVTGTHGKTTTSSLVAHILFHAGLDPSFMIGGIVKGFDSNYRIGKGSFMVIEGDEYDTAFFDKGPKFMHYTPDTAVITGIEFDHADIFSDIDQIKGFFREFVDKIPESSLVMACAENKILPEILEGAGCDIQYYGFAENKMNTMSCNWSCRNLAPSANGAVFNLITPEQRELVVKTPMMGSHNAMNIMAAFGAARRAGVPDDIILDALAHFRGIRRRQDIRGVRNNITVMDDFAHHPTAVRETIAAVKPFVKEGRVVAVFEPRTNSSMRDIFQNDYPASFLGADMVCVRKPSMLSKIPENQRLSTEKLVADIAEMGIDAHYFEDTDSIIEFLLISAKPGDLILVMSNGGFDMIHEKLLERL
ncbi:UDP-N-acetylmuramate:L-alanyl-gamma-D-glutamyl-meso-diaminopimelate ligase [Desulfamplus magnetovallimortis]|uniref:UDP-N-acetylmuramate:L-alanyl-gamma-D-glutamyl-meso-diaminopimelate ligase n=1 Tax=Desulfamplus magnetovallimortis TaxID=1246637 RepID=A0A1W1HDX2_9BACT|nr:UDP-N-acetylmuramate:L-alanyl-gamma-D-glutamyl-meso-diaminopimelate ligase [Desulfamplus magnetovallimortis]SLM30582.1 UDP-N-acetylmuramate:L-alanyl-gamma-D-glutamyl-meso-diaminopimelate ligase [Desulfamplus magnetovallimortis]